MKDLNKLKHILDKQCAACTKMLEQEEEKSRALISGDVQALLAVLSAQQALIMAEKSLEDKRIALCGAWKKMTLPELIDKNPECRAVLEPVFQKLSETVITLRKMNSRNRKLLEARLATNHFMCEQLGIGTANTYTKSVRIRA